MVTCDRHLRYLGYIVFIHLLCIYHISKGTATFTVNLVSFEINKTWINKTGACYDSNGLNLNECGMMFIIGFNENSSCAESKTDKGILSENGKFDFINMTGLNSDDVQPVREIKCGKWNIPTVAIFRVKWNNKGTYDDLDSFRFAYNADPTTHVNSKTLTEKGTSSLTNTFVSNFNVACDEGYYTSSCNISCEPKGDNFKCDKNTGENVCKDGWKDTSRNCTVEETKCDSVTCKNNGTCEDNQSKQNFRCKCSPFFVGTYCQIPNECALKEPCWYGANCSLNIPDPEVDNYTDYTCSCQDQFRGRNCREVMVNVSLNNVRIERLEKAIAEALTNRTPGIHQVTIKTGSQNMSFKIEQYSFNHTKIFDFEKKQFGYLAQYDIMRDILMQVVIQKVAENWFNEVLDSSNEATTEKPERSTQPNDKSEPKPVTSSKPLQTTHIVLIAVGSVIFIVAVIGAAVVLCKCRGRRSTFEPFGGSSMHYSRGSVNYKNPTYSSDNPIYDKPIY